LRQHESGQKRQISELDPQLEPLRHVIHFSQAGYGDDLNLLLGAPFISNLHLRNSLTRRLSQSLIQYIVNFIHYGDPNKHFEIPNIAENLSKSWPPFSIRNELGLKMVKPAIGFSTSPTPEDLIGVVSDHRKQFATFWTDIFPKIAAVNRKSSTVKSNPVTHFVAHPMKPYKDAKVNRLTTPSSRQILEPTAISDRSFTPSNESVEFPSFYDANQTQWYNTPLKTLSKKIKDEDKSILLLVIVVGLSLFLLNIIFTATFYFCHQQRKDQNSSILIPGSEADHRTNKNDATNKPINDMSSFQQSVVKLPGLAPVVNSPYQPQTVALPPDFAYRTLQRTQNPMERHMYPTPVNQTSPLTGHRVMATPESSWKSETLKRNSVDMI
uniref:COesterase domain-containing protein n=1 Tax=Rodentolepis nana TaxID=102285 RepID=A0A0R3T8P1_RODNA